MQISDMIISFDGNVFVGKTTIISNLSSKFGFNKIPEYSDFLNGISLNRDYKNEHKNNQEKYLMVDKERIDLIKDGINLLDRSFVSMSAHVYALNKINDIDIRDFYITRLDIYLSKKEIIIPNKYIIILSTHKIAYKRFTDGHSVKGTEPKYINKDYFNYINEFNLRWLELASGLMINSDMRASHDKIIDFVYEKQSDVFTENYKEVIGKIKKILLQ